MALFCKVGNILSQISNKKISPEYSISNPSLYQAIRCMSSKLFIGGLSYGTDEQSLREAFSKYGDVIEARVIIDRDTGRSRGFGFVTYSESESASSAIQAVDGQELHGRRVKVNYATERAPRSFGGYNDQGYGNQGYGNQGGGYGGNYNSTPDGYGGNYNSTTGSYGGNYNSTPGAYGGNYNSAPSSFGDGVPGSGNYNATPYSGGTDTGNDGMPSAYGGGSEGGNYNAAPGNGGTVGGDFSGGCNSGLGQSSDDHLGGMESTTAGGFENPSEEIYRER